MNCSKEIPNLNPYDPIDSEKGTISLPENAEINDYIPVTFEPYFNCETHTVWFQWKGPKDTEYKVDGIRTILDIHENNGKYSTSFLASNETGVYIVKFVYNNGKKKEITKTAELTIHPMSAVILISNGSMYTFYGDEESEQYTIRDRFIIKKVTIVFLHQLGYSKTYVPIMNGTKTDVSGIINHVYSWDYVYDGNLSIIVTTEDINGDTDIKSFPYTVYKCEAHGDAYLYNYLLTLKAAGKITSCDTNVTVSGAVMDAAVTKSGVISYVHKINQKSDTNYSSQQTAADGLGRSLYVIKPEESDSSVLDSKYKY